MKTKDAMKIKRKLVQICLLISLAFPAVVQAQDAYSTNADGSIYTYSTNADGSANIVAYAGPPWVVTIPTNINGLTVTSIGDFAFFETALISVTIPNSVTSIGVEAFEGCTSLTSVTIGNSVTNIGNQAFWGCSGLRSVTIPNSVTSIGDDAFYDCTSLTSVTIGNGVTNIGYEAFALCTSLTNVTIGNSVTSIGDYAFLECYSLTSVTIPNSVNRIGDYAFWNCSGLTNIAVDAANPNYSSANGVLFDKAQATLIQYPIGLTNSSYTIPNSVTNIGDDAFLLCGSLTSVTIGNSVTSIGGEAFERCTRLTSVTIPDSVTSIGDGAFEFSSLTNVTIPNSVTNIADDAFEYCYSLTNIAVDAANPNYRSANGVLFDKAQATLIEYPIGLTNSSYTIPSSVTSIGDDAFDECPSLTSVTIPNSVTNIGNSAFSSCSSLTNVTIPNSVTSIGDNAFYNCYSLTGVTIPNSVTSIGDSAFYNCYSLTSVTIPNSVTSIGEYAFGYSTSLTSVTIPNSVTSIGNSAFYDCTGLTSVAIENGVTSIGDFAFAHCTSLTSVTIPDSVTSIGDSAFWGCDSLTSVTIGNGVTNIGYEAFYNCYGLTGITIPNSVTSIGEDAFAYCRLTSVTIPNSVTSIGVKAFERCTSLTNVAIPNSVTSIGSYAFDFCTSLTGIYFQGNSPTTNNDSTVFSGDYIGTVYYLPGTTGWGAMFDGLPTAPWFLPNPVILNNGLSFGAQPGGFGFTISWATNASVVVEAATNLANPVWIPLSTSPLTGGTSYFSDPQWTNYPGRFYRVASAFTVGGTLTGLPAGDTVTLQDNGSDSLTLSNNGPFTFPTALPNGYTYSVTASDWSGGLIDWPPVATNVSGTISGGNVTNIAFQCAALITGNRDLDMYNAALADGTANGGVPGVMRTESGGPFRVTALGNNSVNVALTYAEWAWFDKVVGSFSCSSTSFPSGTRVIAFGDVLTCEGGPYEY